MGLLMTFIKNKLENHYACCQCLEFHVFWTDLLLSQLSPWRCRLQRQAFQIRIFWNSGHPFQNKAFILVIILGSIVLQTKGPCRKGFRTKPAAGIGQIHSDFNHILFMCNVIVLQTRSSTQKLDKLSPNIRQTNHNVLFLVVWCCFLGHPTSHLRPGLEPSCKASLAWPEKIFSKGIPSASQATQRPRKIWSIRMKKIIHRGQSWRVRKWEKRSQAKYRCMANFCFKEILLQMEMKYRLLHMQW